MHAPLKRFPLALALVLGLAPAALALAPDDSELQALRFYIQQQDDASTRAELRRLTQLYPDWEPPERLEDLLVTSPSTEIDEIFRLIADGRHADARSAIERTRARFPDWEPPEAMRALLTVSEAQERFEAALVGPDPGAAVQIAAQVPELLACERINNPWRLAEVLAGLDRRADAVATYRAVLETCSDIADLTATAEKAAEIATEAELAALMAALRSRLPEEAARWETLEERLRAGRGFAAAPPAAAPGRGAAAAPRAAAPSSAPPASGGALGQIRAAAARGDWGRCLSLSAGARDPATLYERGWCAFNRGRGMEAIAAFQASAGGRLPAGQRRDALYGLALAYLSQRMVEEAARVAATAPLTQQQRVDIESQIVDQRGIRAYERGDYRRAIAFIDAHVALTGTTRRDLAILRAYALLNMGDRPGAFAAFERLDRQFSSPETRRGLAASR